jgi:hypothetical protein
MTYSLNSDSTLLKGFVASFISVALFCSDASAKTEISSKVCQATLEAALKNDAEGAIAALTPDPSEADGIRELATRMTDLLQGIFKGKAPRLERTLPDIEVASYPTGIQIWSFGDKEVFFVGCLMRLREGRPFIQLQAYPLMDEVIKKLKAGVESY